MKNKIYFIHIPKTAGSSINKIFKTCALGDRYIEHLESEPEKFKAMIKSEGPYFLSGHVTFDASYDLVKRGDVFSFTIVREPNEQLLSHLNWVKYVGSPYYPFPSAIPETIMNLAKNLYETPLSDIDRIAELVDTEEGRRLFDNLQTRYMTDGQMELVDSSHLSSAISNSRKLDLAFALEDIKEGLSIIRKNVPDLGEIERVNKAVIKDCFDLSSAKTRFFIEQCTAHDRQLYNNVREAFRYRMMRGH